MGLLSSLGRVALSEALHGVAYLAKLAAEVVAPIAKEPEELGEVVGPFRGTLSTEAQAMIAELAPTPEENGFTVVPSSSMHPPPMSAEEAARRRANGIVARTIDLTREEP